MFSGNSGLRCFGFTLILSLAGLFPLASASAQEEKLDNAVRSLLTAASLAELGELSTTVDIEIIDDNALLGILIRASAGSDPNQVVLDCNCGLVIESTAAAPPPDPNDPNAPTPFDIFTATIPVMLLTDPNDPLQSPEPLAALVGIPEVVFVSASAISDIDVNIGTNNTGLTDANGVIFLGANAQILHEVGIDGEDVLVGIVDTGIDVDHDDFRDPNGCTRIQFVWDQTDLTGTCQAPAPSRDCQPNDADPNDVTAPGNTFCAGLAVCTNTVGGKILFCGAASIPSNTTWCKNHPDGMPTSVCQAAGATAKCKRVLTGKPPTGFKQGVEWNSTEINKEIGGNCTPADPNNVLDIRAQDNNGHGTHVAGIAAGNGFGKKGFVTKSEFQYEGMAPRTDIIAVKTDFSDDGLIDAAKYIFGKAKAAGQSAVINMSLGGQTGPHDGTDDLARALDNLLGAGKLIVGTAGNEGKLAINADNRGNALALNGMQNVKFRRLGTPKSFTLEIWHHNADRYDVTITGPGGAPSFTVTPGNSNTAGPANKKVTVTNATGDYVDAEFGGTGIQIWVRGEPVDPNTFVIKLKRVQDEAVIDGATVKGDGLWNAYMSAKASAEFIQSTTATDGQPTNRGKVKSPGSTTGFITVASHTTRNIPGFREDTLGGISSFSSPGPTRTGGKKPDLSAPGAVIASSCSDDTGASFCDVDNTHSFKSGTSMAAPHVTGCVALMLQQEPTLTPEKAKERLNELIRVDRLSARTRNGTSDGKYVDKPPTSKAGHWNRDFGNGKLNCALKAEDFLNDEDVLGGDGAFFSVDRGSRGVFPSDVNTDPNTAAVFAGDRFKNGLVINRNVLFLKEKDNIDALSFQIDPRWLVPKPKLYGLEFSVTPGSEGATGTPIRNHLHPAAHVWDAPWPFDSLATVFLGIHFDLYSDSELALDVVDNLNATEIENPLLEVVEEPNQSTLFRAQKAFPIDKPRPGGIGLEVFFSLDPNSPTLTSIGATPSDIFVSDGDANGIGFEIRYEGDPDLSLKSENYGSAGCKPPACDDVDAFFVDHLGLRRFSLAKGSPTLSDLGASPADLLQPGEDGPEPYLFNLEMGLDPNDDVDALDVEICRFSARRTFSLKDGATVGKGVYIETTEPKGKLNVGRGVTAADGTVFAADRVKINKGSNLANVAANLLIKNTNVVIRGVETIGLSLPIPTLNDTFTPTKCDPTQGPDVTIQKNLFGTLGPGTYNRIHIQNGALATFKAGRYHACRLEVGRSAIAEFTGDVASTLFVGERLKVSTGSVFAPRVGTPVPTIHYGGKKTATLKGIDALVHVHAPRAQVRLGRGAVHRGSILARKISSDHSCKFFCPPHPVNLDSAPLADPNAADPNGP